MLTKLVKEVKQWQNDADERVSGLEFKQTEQLKQTQAVEV
jgi:hypothetical protein